MIETQPIPIFGQKHRYLQLKQIAADRQLSFERKMRFSTLPVGLLKFDIFQKKSFKRIRNIFRIQDAEIPGEIMMFDFTYTHKDDLEFKRTTILTWKSLEMDLPKFHLKPKNVMMKLGALFVTSEEEFQEHPQFFRNYKVEGEHRDAINYALKPEVLEFLSEEKGWSIEGNGRYLLCYKKHKTQKPEEITSFLEEGLDIFHWMLHSKTNDFV